MSLSETLVELQVYLIHHEEEREGQYDTESRWEIHSKIHGLKRVSKVPGGFPPLMRVCTLPLSGFIPLPSSPSSVRYLWRGVCLAEGRPEGQRGQMAGGRGV